MTGEYTALERLKKIYDHTINEKIAKLTLLIEHVHQHPDRESLVQLQQVVHKIAGSAGSYGYMEVSQSCRALDIKLTALLELPELPHMNEVWHRELDDFLACIKLQFTPML